MKEEINKILADCWFDGYNSESNTNPVSMERWATQIKFQLQQQHQKDIEKIEKMRFGEIDEKFSQVGLTLKQRIAVKDHIRQLRINTLDEVLNTLKK